MDYFAPGLLEMRRLAGRLHRRIKLHFALRQLAAAETELGLLGWQQAEYDDATQIEVDKIENAEREQSRLTNAAAQSAREIREESERLEAYRKTASVQDAELEQARAAVREKLTPIEEKIASLRKKDPDYEKLIPALDKEQKQIEELYTQVLLIQPQSPEIRDEIFRMRERLIAIPNEKEDLRSRHMRIAADLEAKESEAAVLSSELAEIDSKLRALRKDLDEKTEQINQSVHAREKERARLEAENEKLERTKENPYRAIGRVLADSGIVPVNQPHVFEKVKAIRIAISSHETWIAESHAESRAANRAAVQSSLILWAVVIIAIALLVGALL